MVGSSCRRKEERVKLARGRDRKEDEGVDDRINFFVRCCVSSSCLFMPSRCCLDEELRLLGESRSCRLYFYKRER
jgi:hypothetical protein